MLLDSSTLKQPCGLLRGFPIKAIRFAPRRLSSGDLVCDGFFLQCPLIQPEPNRVDTTFREPPFVQKGSGLGTFHTTLDRSLRFYSVTHRFHPMAQTHSSVPISVIQRAFGRRNTHAAQYFPAANGTHGLSGHRPSYLLRKHPLYADASFHSDTDNHQSAGRTWLAPRTTAAVSNGPASLYHQA